MKNITKDEVGEFLCFNELIHQEDVIITDIYGPNIRTWKYIKKKNLTITEN